MTLYYLPLESYEDRYTMQWTAPKTGWLEKNWIKARIDYERIDSLANTCRSPESGGTVTTGVVLNPTLRTKHCFAQVSQIIEQVMSGAITNKDVIYWDDFWHPGIEALPYTFQQVLGPKEHWPKCYAFLHAQSVDEYDFTYPMRNWMRCYELGQVEWMTGVFVDCPSLKSLLVHELLVPQNKVHVVGLPFDVEEVMSRMPANYQFAMRSSTQETPIPTRKNQVVFSSRWDKEKDPMFFLRVAEAVLKSVPKLAPTFVVTTSAPKLRSNDSGLITALQAVMERNPGRVVLRENQSKEDYYATLAESKVQFNCSDQDWVSYTLLEGSAAGCVPVYPWFRSFPETLLRRREFMYCKGEVCEAANHVAKVLLRNDLWTRNEIEKRSWIHNRFNNTWARMLWHMGYNVMPQNDPFVAEEWGM